LNKEEQKRELSKIATSIFNFLPLVKIQEPGALALDYELWGHLRDFYINLDRYRLTILIKSKQIGISWALATRVLYRLMTRPGANILEISKGKDEARDLLGKTQIIYNNLPEWLKDTYVPDPNSSERFGFKAIGSTVTAFASTEDSGLGHTSDWVIHDEGDFHDYFETNLGHTLATVADSNDRELTIVSTVDENRSDTDFQLFFKAALGNRNSFHAMFYPYNVRPNRDEAWLQERMKEYEATPWVIGKNFPRTIEEALSPVSTKSCFDKERLDALWYNTIEKPDVEQGFIYILYPPRAGTQYVGGVDVGEGVGLDYSCLTIIGKQGLQSEVVAVIYTNEVGTDLFAYECDKLCRKYHNALLGVENNSLGVAVTNKLVELGYPNLYYGKNKKVGWTTGQSNKQTGIVELIQSINDGSLITRFKPQVKEMMEYQWVKGKPGPTGKTHGDTVMSLMIGNQMLKEVYTVRPATMYINGVKIR